MRTKNPFCSALQLDVLCLLLKHQEFSPLVLADKLHISTASIARALTQLKDAGHVTKYTRTGNARAGYFPTDTGRILITCARRIDLARERK